MILFVKEIKTMTEEKKPNEIEHGCFLTEILEIGNQAEGLSIAFELSPSSGKRHPRTVASTGTAISYVYASACCRWGCRGGNHTIERLLGKAANQAISAFKLYRMGYYDESLMLTRGIGEIANLLHLFYQEPSKISTWENLNDRQRFSQFKPSKVRNQLVSLIGFAPIDSERYSKLCSVGTHPDPNEIPGHYTGTGIPVLGMVLQEAGAFVAMNELGFALGLVLSTIPKLLKLEKNLGKEMQEAALHLIRELGDFTIINYNQLLKDAHHNPSVPSPKT
jgi:hypothetical protein